jgi:hypothetical protein
MVSSMMWGMPCLVLLSRHPRSAVWRHAVGLPCTIAVPGRCSVALTPHCSHLSACLAETGSGACPHILHAMMALMSGALETCTRVLGTGEPCLTGRPASFFFVLEAHGGSQDARELGALNAGRRDPEPQDTWHARAIPSGLEPRYTW